jgi:VWFA-related protein
MAVANWLGVFILSSTICFSSTATFAQQQDTQKLQSSGPITLDVVVTRRSGAPVAGLHQEDFAVLDNKASQKVTSFAELGGEKAPVEVLLVIDAVNASFSTVALERNQIKKFLRSHGERLAYPTSLALVTDTGTQVQQSFSTDGNAISAALDQYTIQLRTIRRSSGFYGASDRMNLSIKALYELAAREGTKPGRKLILWVSPGWPLLSGPGVQLGSKQQQQIFSTVVQLSTQLRQARVTLYALDPLGADESVFRSSYYESFVKGLTKPQDALLGNMGLQVFAAHTGGLVLNSNDLTALLQRSTEDTTAYYEITYDPPPAEHRDEYHAIDVRVTKPGLTARTLQGYYSQP